MGKVDLVIAVLFLLALTLAHYANAFLSRANGGLYTVGLGCGLCFLRISRRKTKETHA
jgi:hypothetical protein